MGSESDWLMYVRLVPEDTRKAIAKELINIDIDGHAAVVKAGALILREVLEGNIPPDVANTAHKYLKLILETVNADIAIRLAQSKDAADPNEHHLKILDLAEQQSKGRPQLTTDAFDQPFAERHREKVALLAREDTP